MEKFNALTQEQQTMIKDIVSSAVESCNQCSGYITAQEVYLECLQNLPRKYDPVNDGMIVLLREETYEYIQSKVRLCIVE